MKNTKHLYQHFAEEDREFVDKSLEQMQRIEDSYSFEVTSFVNPHQVEVLRNLENICNCKYFQARIFIQVNLLKLLLLLSTMSCN